MHVCIFTTAHPWDDVRVKSKFVDSFLDAGDRVTWIGPDRAFFESAASRDPRVEHRLLASPPGWKGRVLAMRSLRSALAELEDVDWVYTPDPDAAALALTVPGTRVLFDIHEEYHKGHLAQSVPRAVRGASERAIRAAIAGVARRCDLVTSVNQAILDAYAVGNDKGFVTFNTPPSWFTRVDVTSDVGDGAVTFFHGKALAGNGTGVVVDGLAEVRRRGVDARVVMFPSNGAVDAPPYDPSFAARSREPDVDGALVLVPGLAHRAMPAVMGAVDAGLIAYDRVLGAGSLPNRFFEYLALGIPVIVPEYAPLMRDIVLEEGVGRTADFEDPDSVADAMQLMAADPAARSAMGERARSAFTARYAWAPIFGRLRQRMVRA
ncbi:glycosyltransferase [Knoellia locipacati]|uniref:glycosyltransferase family protein n=1 Tax=Knoellia locipacati TaxID=882824 RepID=UPI0038511731